MKFIVTPYGEMYKGFVLNENGEQVASTSPYWNRKNARAAAIALLRDVQKEAAS